MPLPAITRVSNLQVSPSSTNKEKGFYTAPITTTQRDALTQTNGLFIANTTTGTFQGLQNGTWGNMNTSASLFALKRTATAANYQVLVTDVIIGVTSTALARTIILPAVANTIAGQIIIVKDESGGANANNITVDGSGAETIDGAANVVISANYGSTRVYSSGTAWFTF